MKIALLSDLHIPARNSKARLDDSVATAFDKLTFIYNYCYENKIKTILQAGDFFDAPRSWSLLPTISSFLKVYKDKINTCTVFGQHDTYLYSEVRRSSTNLGVLEKAGLLTILSDKTVHPSSLTTSAKRIFIHGVNWGDKIEKCIRKSNEYHILVAHISISDRAAYPGHKFTDAEKALEKYGYDCMLVGDVHLPFMYARPNQRGGQYIVNTGPMMRLAANEDMMKHRPHFAVIDIDEPYGLEIIPIEVAKPSSEVLSRKHLVKGKRIKDVTNDFINTLQATGSKIKQSTKQKLEKYLNQNKIESDIKTILMVIIEEEEGLDE